MKVNIFLILIVGVLSSSCSYESAEEEVESLIKNHKAVENKLVMTEPQSGYYLEDSIITLQINHPFEMAVTGVPRVALDIGGQTRYANYVSGTGTKKLIFRYTVVVGDDDSSGIAIAAEIDLNGGTITFEYGGEAKDVELDYVVPNNSIVVDTSAPSIVGISPPATMTYLAGKYIRFSAVFDQNVFVSGTPNLEFNVGGQIKSAKYAWGSGTSTLSFEYQVQSGDLDTDGIIVTSPLKLNGGKIKDKAGNASDLTFVPIPSAEPNAILVDGETAYVVDIIKPADGTYSLGDSFDFTLVFNEKVFVSNNQVRVGLNIDGGIDYASYVSGSGSKNLVFRYQVAPDLVEEEGVTFDTAIDLNGDTIIDVDSYNASLILPQPAMYGVVIDGARSKVIGIIIPSAGTYTVGDSLYFALKFDDNITVSGTPSLLINIQSDSPTPAEAIYYSGSGSDTLTFRYIVDGTDVDNDGIALGSTLSLNAGQLLDPLGYQAKLDISEALALVDSSNILLDNVVAQTVTINTPDPVNLNNVASYILSGTCSENGAAVSIDIGGVTDSITCSSGIYTSNSLNLSGVSDNSAVAITADHGTATQAQTTVLKDTVIPTISVSAASDINSSSASSYSLSGSCSENTRQVSVDVGGITGSATCSSNAWSANLNVSSLSDGSGIAISVTHQDVAGNSATPATDSADKDTVIPTVSIISPVDISGVNASSYSVGGSCSEDGQNVSVSVGGISGSTSCSSGAWTVSGLDVSSLSNGSVTILADHVDAVGNNATQASDAVNKSSASVALDTPLADINLANITAYTVTGTCSENGVAVDVNIGSVNESINCSSGVFSTSALDVSSLSDGSSISVTADHSDAPQASSSVIKDTLAPTVAINAPAVVNIANVASYSLTGTCNENGAQVDLIVGSINTTSTCSSGTWSKVLDMSSVGDNSNLAISADLQDAVGNSATQATANTAKDTVAPTVNITSAADITGANVTSYSVIGDCSENGQSVSVSLGGIALTPTCSSGSWSVTGQNVSGLSDGSVNITADISDSAGNNASGDSTAVNKNTATPTVTINTPTNIDQSNQTAYSLSGNCSENSLVVSVAIGALNFSPNCTGGVWNLINIDVSSLADNPSIAITADHSTATQAQATVAKDTSGPTVTISMAQDINASNESNYVVSGSCSENGRTVDVYIDGMNFTPTCSSGAWSTGLQDVSGLSDGSILITADHDNAALVPATQAQVTINKDTVNPTVTNLSVPSTLVTSADLTWGQEGAGGFTINDYIINYRIKGSPTWLTFNDGTSTATNTTVTSLSASTIYEFRVAVQYDTTEQSPWSNIAEGETKPDDPLFGPNVAMNVGGAVSSSVVAFEDGTNVTLNGSPLVTLNKGQTHIFTSVQFDVIDADKPIFTAGRIGSSGAGAANKANIVWNPTTWAGKSFSFNATRNNPQILKVYAIENATITVKQGSTVLDSATLTSGNGTVLSWSVYGSYQVSSTGTILAFHSSGSGTTYYDPKPLLPSHTEMIGFPSSSMSLTVSLDATNYYFVHGNSTTGSGSMNRQDVLQVNSQGTSSLYQGFALLVNADKGISGASFADTNGGCASVFLPTNLMKTKYAINASADYVAFASKQAGTIEVYNSSDVLVTTLTLTRSGGDPNAPYNARIGTSSAGYRFISTVPVAGWYQPNSDTGGADEDETILYGTND